MPYVTERWLGGMLTNWSTMHARIQELDRLEGLRDSGEISRLTKKEGLLIQREIDRLLIRLSGVRKMRRLPELVFVVDVGREDAAVHEANLLKVPVVALVDTNCNPQGIDYVIPSNDDAIRAIKLLVAKVADSVLEGKAMRKDQEPEEPSVDLGEGAAESARPRRTTHVVETEQDLEEGALLGESTLAKLSATRKPEDVAPAPEATAPVTEPPLADAAPAAEPAVASAETPAAEAPVEPKPDGQAPDPSAS
jgi:small subunit ribosomal protein S2